MQADADFFIEVGKLIESQQGLVDQVKELTTELGKTNERLQKLEQNHAFARGGWKGATLVASFLIAVGAGLYYLVDAASHFFNLQVHQ